MKSFPGCCETDAYVFRISDFSRATSRPVSTAIGLERTPGRALRPSRVGDARHRLRPWLRTQRHGEWPGRQDPESAAGGERSDHGDRRATAPGICNHACQQRADHDAEVTPETVDAYRLRAISRPDGVGDCRDQRRIDEGRADAEE